MRGSRTIILAGIIAAVAALPSPARSAAPQDFVGIVADEVFRLDPGQQRSEFARMQSAGITLIRRTFDWSFIEFEKGVYNFSLYDPFVGSAAHNGVRVMPLLFNPPKFWSSRPRRKAIRGTYFPSRLSAMGDFGAAVVRRYGPNGTFWVENPHIPKVPMTAYQVWNEPNLRVYDPPNPSPKRYTKMLKATAKGIRSADPGAEIVSAGLPDSKLSRPKNVFKYVEAMYRAGAKSSFDTLAVNPYGRTVKEVMREVNRFRAVMRRFGDSSASIWVTEIGWSDTGPRSPQTVGARGQAARIGQVIKTFGRQRAKLNLRGFVYFAWSDGAVYSKELGDFWGLHTGLHKLNGAVKPALHAFEKAVAAL